MENKIDFEKLTQKVQELEMITEKLKTSLSNFDQLMEDNIQSGKGIWDGESAILWKEEWKQLIAEMPEVIDTFQKQSKNIQNFIEIMKKTEQS